MDIFATTVTSCRLIYTFLDGCKEFSDDAKSLAVRFEHDTKALQKVLDYFSVVATKDASGSSVLPPDHQSILDDCVRNLEGLLSKATALGTRLKSKKWYRVGINHATWWLYKGEIENLAKELFEWTLRFDVHTFSLPNSIKHVINTQDRRLDAGSGKTQPFSLLAVQQRVARIVELGNQYQVQHGEQLHINDHVSRVAVGPILQGMVNNRDDDRNTQAIGRLDGRQVLLEERKCRGYFLYDDHRTLASILSQADSSVGLLKCAGFFSDSRETGRNDIDQGGTTFAFEIPGASVPNVKIDSLYNVLRLQGSSHCDGKLVPSHSLSQRYKLARRLAIAVLFVHSVEWVHKSIDPRNIIIVSRPDNEGNLFDFSRSYLCGFTSARSIIARSDPRGGYPPTAEDFYIHPARRTYRARYTRTHDIYSLGVVLLEVGLWTLVEKRLATALKRLQLEHERNRVDDYLNTPGNSDFSDSIFHPDDPVLGFFEERTETYIKERQTILDNIRSLGGADPNQKIDSFYYWLREQVLSLLDELAATMGDTYRDVVRWCLLRRVGGSGGSGVDNYNKEDDDDEVPGLDEFVNEVVEKLEDLAAVI